MKILLTGTNGQVGRELASNLRSIGEVICVNRSSMDLTDLNRVREVIRASKPNLIVNPAAYTAVDKAESEPALARTVNAYAPAVIAEEAERLGAALVHYSTDYVFNGEKSGPYRETDSVCPVNVYGQTKAEGEEAIASSGVRHLILRTSWVYGARGRNFLLTMLQSGHKFDQLHVVDDQYGAPTWSRRIADITVKLLGQSHQSEWWEQFGGVYHLSSQGRTSWYGMAVAIGKIAGLGCRFIPISTDEYGALARRPANSLLDSSKLSALIASSLPSWQEDLGLCMAQLGKQDLD